MDKSAPVAKICLARGLVLPQPNPERRQASMLAEDTDAVIPCDEITSVSPSCPHHCCTVVSKAIFRQCWPGL